LKCQDATNDHPYLKRKGVKGYGLKLLKETLLVPVQDESGTLHGIQFVQSDGSKRFKSGTDKTGHFCSIGIIQNNTVVIAEGYATAASIHQGTGHSTLVAFDSGNLLSVAKAVREKHPDRVIILAADNDQFTDGNPGLTKAIEACRAVKGLLAVPIFKDVSDKPTDFNDLALLEGLARVREVIEGAANPENQVPQDKFPFDNPLRTYQIQNADPAPSTDNAMPEQFPSDNWPEPVLFGEVETPEIPAKSVPAWLGDFCQALAAATQTPPGLSVMFALGAVAACLQKRFVVSAFGDDYTEALSVWTVTALDPGNRKTAVRNAFTEPLSQWEHEEANRLKPDIKRVKHQREIGQKAIEQIKARASKSDTTGAGREALLEEIAKIEDETPEELIAPRLWADDVTPERLQSLLVDHGGRMALLSDEGGIFEVMSGLYSGGRANLNVFLQGHAGSPIRVDRQGRSITIEKPALTFGLAVQPSVIKDLGTGSKMRFRGNGTLARFLYCLPKSTIGTRDVTQRIKIPDDVKAEYTAGMKRLLEIEAKYDSSGRESPRLLTLSPDALRAWQLFGQYIEDRQGQDGEFYSIQDWTSKLPGAALRISGLFHVVEHGAAITEINLSTVEKALDLCELLIAHAQTAFDMMGAEPLQNDARIVLRWIVATGKLSFRQNEAIKAIRQFRTIDRLEAALKVLTSRNIISKPHKKKSGGRPAILYAVNPAVLPSSKAMKQE
jgi:putative DNA primase/helicase